MQSFLETLASEIYSKHPKNLGEVAIVLPNRRAHLFLREAFKGLLLDANWLPNIISIEDFIVGLSGFEQVEQLDLLFELYQVHLNIEGAHAEAFEDFIQWATILIQDFNEIDRYLINAEEIYSFLNEAKALETWNLDGESLSEFQKKYLNFWEKLPLYYSEFNKLLSSKKMGYQGLCFRKVAELPSDQIQTAHHKIYFAGFNALTSAEQVIINHFVKNQNAETIWDADEYYLRNKQQEAGLFLRKLMQSEKPNWVFDFYKTQAKSIKIYPCTGNIAQAKLIGQLIDTNQINKTAIILADEALLQASLESLPNEIKKINVTMGFPLSHSILFTFFENILKIQSQFFQSKIVLNKDLLPVIQHPIVFSLSNNVKNELSILKDKFETQRSLSIEKESLVDINKCFGFGFFALNERQLKEQLNSFTSFCKELAANNKVDNLLREAAFQLHQQLNKIVAYADKLKGSFNAKLLLQLYQQVISSETIPFIGEPLEGLQIMGVLESRTLDFENVIVCSLNEGTWPAGKSQNSFIAYDIKRKFGLPSYKEKDAIFAYHFYRLIQRAKNVHLLYNQRSEGINVGEKSRFIMQLQEELPYYNNTINISEVQLNTSGRPEIKEEFSITSNQTIRDKIEKHLLSGLSPSAINNFINCPLDYYYTYVLGLKEEQSADITEPSLFGDIVHAAMEKLYQPYLNQNLSLEILSKIIQDIETKTMTAFLEKANLKQIIGQSLIAYESVKMYVKNILNMDMSLLKNGSQLMILAVEEKVSKDIKLNSGRQIKIKGTIDRIDNLDGQIRLIDYKTGKVEPRDINKLTVAEFMDNKSAKAIQLLIYYLICAEKYPNANSGIISLKSQTNEVLHLKSSNISSDEKKQLLSLADDFLNELIEKMLATDLEFSHNPKSEYCIFCK